MRSHFGRSWTRVGSICGIYKHFFPPTLMSAYPTPVISTTVLGHPPPAVPATPPNAVAVDSTTVSSSASLATNSAASTILLDASLACWELRDYTVWAHASQGSAAPTWWNVSHLFHIVPIQPRWNLLDPGQWLSNPRYNCHGLSSYKPPVTVCHPTHSISTIVININITTSALLAK